MFRNQSKKSSTWSRLLHGRRDRNELITKGILKQAYFGSSIQEILKQEKVILRVVQDAYNCSRKPLQYQATDRLQVHGSLIKTDYFREKFLNSLHGALSILSVTLIQMEFIELLQIKLQFILFVSMLTKGLKSQNGNMDQIFMSFVVH